MKVTPFKQSVARKVAQDTGVSLHDVNRVLNSFFGILVEEFMDTGDIRLPNFVHFYATRIKDGSRKASHVSSREGPVRDISCRASISRGLRFMFLDFGPHSGRAGFVTRDNWLDVIKAINKARIEGSYKRDYSDNGFEYQTRSEVEANELKSDLTDYESSVGDETLDLMDELL